MASTSDVRKRTKKKQSDGEGDSAVKKEESAPLKAKRNRTGKKSRWTKEEKDAAKSTGASENKVEQRPKKAAISDQMLTLNFELNRTSRKRVLASLEKVNQSVGIIGSERIRFIAKELLFTGSVAIVDNTNENDGIQVVTTTQPNVSLIENASISISMARIFVKPLLVLDINGVLCHRIRDTTMPPDVYRKALDKPIANTKIVVRPSLDMFLEYLFENFCVAIWTSAKERTAKELVANLIPSQLRNKLLFVWHQADCLSRTKTNPDSGQKETTFHKELLRVWHCFPLWNALNTVLIDDSPQKSTHGSQMNMVNPPSLNGRGDGSCVDQSFLDDHENVAQQQRFFSSMVDLWKSSCVVEHWETGLDLSILRNSGDLFTFLSDQSSVSNIGWSGGH